ncbi:response regulator transcription factor [Tepidiforma sp.]|uniref:response regulator n=1 Tax=Tepidiforma sp. TaxID=2682230 RepID=UPI0021DDAEC5|nr:response regulator transcription factor [Tepidiforma sp.]MCX7617411.1 response regulator transcription factor [Tepidiforma sp.]GIW17420.1 MAG: DNA-binding response regulator [Tepidiforma sp.]
MSAEPLLLVVDDEAGVLRLMKLELTAQGFRVITAADGEEALRLAEEQRPDAIVLDIMMPGISGLEVMRRLRERSNVPIILVTAKDKDSDKVRGLELGADDYVVKPFNPDELGARIRAVLRRAVAAEVDRVVRAGNVEIDLNRRLVHKNGEQVSLTRTEWLLLQHLAANPDKVILAPELLSKVWGPEYRDDLQYLRVWVSRLRAKIEDAPAEPRIIKTLPGIGYMLSTDGGAES